MRRREDSARNSSPQVSYCNGKGMRGMEFWTMGQMVDASGRYPILEAAKPSLGAAVRRGAAAGSGEYPSGLRRRQTRLRPPPCIRRRRYTIGRNP